MVAFQRKSYDNRLILIDINYLWV